MKVDLAHPAGIAKAKRRVRQKLAGLSFDRKLEALISLQKTARDMVKASGRHFHGIVWCSKTN